MTVQLKLKFWIPVQDFKLDLRKACIALVLAPPCLAGCTTLPSSGPTSSQIYAEANAPGRAVDFRIHQVIDMASLPTPLPVPVVFNPTYAPPATTTIGKGDVLEIAIYETGVTLFGRNASVVGEGMGSSASAERFPPVRVDDAGQIQLPFIGKIQAAGLTSNELESNIRRSYRRMSQNPQALVSIRETIGNSVILAGEIVRPGRLALSTNLERLSDAVALAGGYRGDAKDLSIRLDRRGEAIELRLSDVMSGHDRDLRVYPGDKISVLREPRTFAVMGAPGRVENMTFSATTMTLAEALAQAGGANPNLGDAKAIFVLRIETDETGAELPLVYHLNMMKASGLLLSQRFEMRDKDLIYVGNAQANQPAKLVQLVSQLFSPILTVGTLVNSASQ